MQELMTYVEMIKEAIDNYHGKEVVFYNDGAWYSRDYGRNITLEELKKLLGEVLVKEDRESRFQD